MTFSPFTKNDTHCHLHHDDEPFVPETEKPHESSDVCNEYLDTPPADQETDAAFAKAMRADAVSMIALGALQR